MSSSKKSALQSKFLNSLTDGERERIFALTRELSGALEEWVKRYPQLMRAVRVPQLSLTLAATASFLSVRELLPAARLSMWLFAVDDLCDEGSAEERAQGAAERWSRLERGVALLDEPAGTGDGDPLLQSMRDIRDELGGFPLFAPLRASTVGFLREVLRAMQREDAWATRYRQSPQDPLPSSRDYLETGLHSVAVLPVYLSMLATMGDDSIPSHLPRLLEMGHEAALCIRLANDLRSYERELAEGKLNSLVILQRELSTQQGLEPAAALERARAEVKARMAGALERCVEIGRRARTGSARPERYTTDLMSFVCDFYAHHDYHHTVVTQDSQ